MTVCSAPFPPEDRRQVLCFGNSNTYGYDPRSYLGDRYPETVRWTGILNSAFGRRILNHGENGRQIPHTAGALADAAALVSRTRPAVLAVMLGTNDLLMNPGFTARDAAGRMEILLGRLLRAAGPETRVLLVAPPPLRPGAWVGEDRLLVQSARLGGCYLALARQLSVSFADAGGWGVSLTFDGVHFTPEGHQAFAAGISPLLTELLRQ